MTKAPNPHRGCGSAPDTNPLKVVPASRLRGWNRRLAQAEAARFLSSSRVAALSAGTTVPANYAVGRGDTRIAE